MLRAIGPVWDGNEVWLLAAGGTLYFAFPHLYASSFSGFYLPLTIVLWLLILRGIGIEFRAHIETPVWQDHFDGWLSASPAFCWRCFLGWHWATWCVEFRLVQPVISLSRSGPTSNSGPQTGILDWYTVLIGVMALVTLTAHGSYYVAVKTDEDLGRRARGLALLCWPVQFFLTFTALVATYFIRPEIMANYGRHPAGILIPIVVVGSLAVMLWANPKGKENSAFVASSLYIAFMLVGAAFALYPIVLPARDHQYDLTIYNTAAGNHGLSVGLGLVDARSCAGGGVFYLRLPHVSRQGATGRRALLERSAFSCQLSAFSKTGGVSVVRVTRG